MKLQPFNYCLYRHLSSAHEAGEEKLIPTTGGEEPSLDVLLLTAMRHDSHHVDNALRLLNPLDNGS